MMIVMAGGREEASISRVVSRLLITFPNQLGEFKYMFKGGFDVGSLFLYFFPTMMAPLRSENL